MKSKIPILLLRFSLLSCSMEWFFEPNMDFQDKSQLISAHAKMLDSVIKVPQRTRPKLSDNLQLEREGKSSEDQTEGRVVSVTERFARQSFNLIPFESLAKNVQLLSPSSTFSKRNVSPDST